MNVGTYLHFKIQVFYQLMLKTAKLKNKTSAQIYIFKIFSSIKKGKVSIGEDCQTKKV